MNDSDAKWYGLATAIITALAAGVAWVFVAGILTIFDVPPHISYAIADVAAVSAAVYYWRRC